MKFFIDTANIDEIKQAIALGMCDGVTTNPSLVAKEGKSYFDLAKEICALVSGPVSLETVAQSADAMLSEGRKLAELGENVVVKLPMCEDALVATKRLAQEGIRVNMTLCFSPMQALLAAKAGAAYISPFVGRLDDISHDGMALIEEIVTIYDNYAFETEVLVASIRHPKHLLDAALMGADVATIPFSVLAQLVKHPLTDSGIAKFNEDSKKVEGHI